MSSLWGFREVGVARSLVFCVVLWRHLFLIFSFFLLAIVFSVHQFTDSDYPFGIFICFLLVLSGVRIARSLVFCDKTVQQS
jgi:hypothetical protein